MTNTRDNATPPPAYDSLPGSQVRPLEDVDNGTQPLLGNSEDPIAQKPSDVTRYNGVHHDAYEPEERRSSSSSVSSILSRDLRQEDPLDDDEETGLTQGDREEITRRKKRSSTLSARVAGRAANESEVKDLSKKTFWQKVGINVTLIGLWYLFSICISVYNKWMFAPENLNFHFPMFTTSCHMLMQFALSSLVLLIFPRFRPKGEEVKPANTESEVETSNEVNKPAKRKPLMTPWFYLSRIVSCATVTGLDIGLGNTSLKYISLTFFTMCKSSTLGFVLAFAILFRLEKPSWKIGAIIAVMTVGVIMMVAGETAFDTLGFVLLMMASLCSGLRWSLTQILLRRTPATSNPFATLFFLTPIMFVVLFIIAVPLEGLPSVAEGIREVGEEWGFAFSIGILLFPGVLAFLMVSAEFALLQRTSVVTLSVCGIFKEVLTISAAGLIFGDTLTPINISGLCISLAAIVAYNYIRMKKMKKKVTKRTMEATEGQGAPTSTEPLTDQEPTQDEVAGETTAMVRQARHSSTGIETQSPVENGHPRASIAKRVGE